MTSTSTTAKRRFSFRRKAASPLADGHRKKTFWQRVYRDRYLLLLFLPCLIYYILFKYVPMWGVLISFKDFKPFIGFMGSDWVGLKHYVNFFSNPDAWRIIRNTLFLGVCSLVWCFPFPILLCSGAERGHPYPVQKVCPNHQLYAALFICRGRLRHACELPLPPSAALSIPSLQCSAEKPSTFCPLLPGSAPFMWHPKSGRHWAGAPLSIWLLSVMWTRSNYSSRQAGWCLPSAPDLVHHAALHRPHCGDDADPAA